MIRLLGFLSLLLGCAAWAAPAAPVLVRMDTTLGRVELQLDPEHAPRTVANFVAYVQAGFYDGLIFTRVIPGFMAQGGAYDLRMQPRPARAPIDYEGDNGLKNLRGSIAMARGRYPNTATSEFFINLVDNPMLDGNPDNFGYVVFGQVIKGLSVVDRMATIPTGPGVKFQQDVPKKPIVITSMKLIEAAPARKATKSSRAGNS